MQVTFLIKKWFNIVSVGSSPWQPSQRGVLFFSTSKTRWSCTIFFGCWRAIPWAGRHSFRLSIAADFRFEEASMRVHFLMPCDGQTTQGDAENHTQIEINREIKIRPMGTLVYCLCWNVRRRLHTAQDSPRNCLFSSLLFVLLLLSSFAVRSPSPWFIVVRTRGPEMMVRRVL